MAEAFAGIKKIQYEGPKSKNPLAFKRYDAEEVVEGKTMAEHLRFSVAFWHASAATATTSSAWALG